MKNEKLNGKVAFITGANRGLGLETARELGKKGIVVVLGSRDQKKGEVAAAKLREEGINAESLGFDITKPQDHQKAYDYFAKKHGHLDILVNNAGVWKESDTSSPGSVPKPASSVSPEILRDTFDTNFFATVALTQKLLPHIRKAPAGRIVNVSSILGHSHSRPTRRHQFMRLRSLPMMLRRQPSMRSLCILPTNCATPKSKSTQRILAG